ncbi:MAG: glycosyltransferase [Synergistaceae bacterium]|nr:glycosyltransferase [Synergistaceae bacterium]
MTHYSIAVIIATKNRAEAVRTISLPSLERLAFRDFICVIWDSSEDDDTLRVAESGNWSFKISYTKAPRVGSSSQRNDAVLHVHAVWPSVRYIVFIDDDSELSSDALEGVWASFQDSEVWGVNIPFTRYPYAPSVFRRLQLKICHSLFKKSGRGVVLPCLYPYLTLPETRGAEVDYLVAGGMGLRMEVFTELEIFFPEAFQRFGGYALLEDLAISFYLKHKLKRKIINSVHGSFVHHSVVGGRLDTQKYFAARWFNIHLLFEEIYDDCGVLAYFLRRIALDLFHLIHFTWYACVRACVGGVLTSTGDFFSVSAPSGRNGKK